MRVLTLGSPSRLIVMRIAVGVGSAQDPPGKEGLASLTARMLIEGSFGDAQRPVTKEALARIVRPWGEAARPRAIVDKEMTTFAMTVPDERLAEFTAQVLAPMFTQPLFAREELERLRSEQIVALTSEYRFESQEDLGLRVIDNLLHRGTALQHLAEGTVHGIRAVTTQDLRRFYQSFYRPRFLRVALSTSKPESIDTVRRVLSGAGGPIPASPFPFRRPAAAAKLNGRSLTIVSMPDAIATGVHLGFPITVKRGDPDYWPLDVANIWFGTHRDSFSHLYEVIRRQRGYNYGDYSYIEWMHDRSGLLFPPPNHPRTRQDFTIWLRPVAHEYAYHLMKAALFELTEFLARGLTAEEVGLAKTKARVLYLSLAEDTERRTASLLDDDFYGLERPYLDDYLSAIDSVMPDQVNAALRRHLQTRDVAFVVVTDDAVAPRLAEEVGRGGAVYGKGLKEYNITSQGSGGQAAYTITAEQVEMLRRDGAWAGYPLEIPADRIRVVPAADLFETARP